MSKKRKERPRREQESPEKQGQEVSSGHSRKRSSATKDTGGTASQLDYRKSFGGKSEKFTRFVFSRGTSILREVRNVDQQFFCSK